MPSASSETIKIEEALKVAKIGANLLSAVSMLAIAVSLAVIAAEIVNITYLDDEHHYIMHIGTHEAH